MRRADRFAALPPPLARRGPIHDLRKKLDVFPGFEKILYAKHLKKSGQTEDIPVK